MDLKTWLILYQEILEDMHYSIEDDERSARELARILKNRRSASIDGIRERIRGRTIVVTGGGMRERDLDPIPDAPILASGSSIRTLMEGARTPTMIFTDLDGDLRTQRRACSKGSIAVVHAHGDNIALLKEVERFDGEVLGTCQCASVPPLFNFGGFTDGDRAVAFAVEMGASAVSLVGFRFDAPVPNTEMKRKKLAWAKRIIEILAEQGNIKFAV